MTNNYVYGTIHMYIYVKEEVYPFLRVCLHKMNKRLLNIITTVSLAASVFATGTLAAPALVETQDSATEFFPAPEEFVETESQTESVTFGPSAVLVADTATEQNTVFGTPALFEGASLMSELSGDGTEESPYLITSADDLFLMANNVNTGVASDAYYKLTTDIDLGGAEWAPIGHHTKLLGHSVSFCGVFDGDGHTISNFQITKEDVYYVGLFGLVSGGTIKNLNVKDAYIDVNFTDSQILYVGTLVGRMKTNDPNSLSSITNCTVSDSTVNAHNNGAIFAGGLAGSVVSGDYKNASIFVAFAGVENVDVNISTSTKNASSDGTPNMIIGGGLIGFLTSQVDSTLTVINSYANADVSADSTASATSQPLVGGLFGNVVTYASNGEGNMSISSCYSEGTVTANSDFHPYIAGGFAGQLYATKNLEVKDSYSSSDVTGYYKNAGYTIVNETTGTVLQDLDPSAGGFAGQMFYIRYVTSFPKTVINCYSSGDVIDTSTPSGKTPNTDTDYSFIGGFTGWTTANVFENCYRFEAQQLVGSDLNYTDNGNITVLSEQDSKYLDKYVGFDMNKTWEMDPEAEYFYPTLREKMGYANFVSDGVSFATDVFDTDGRISEPSDVPTKAQTIEKVYTFNYWSLSENGSPFNFGGDALTENTTFYAVFKSEPRSYNIRFESENELFASSKLAYGTVVKTPAGIPEKADDDKFFYTFSHWSDMAGGNEFNFSDYTVVGEKTFFAVFEATDKTAWTGSVAESFSSGFGTQALPYVIKSADEFALLEKVINENTAGYTDAYYELGADINLGGNYWVPIGNSKNHPFGANFDGNGYTVSNFKVVSGQYMGLFGFVRNGTIKNVGVANFTIDCSISSEDLKGIVLPKNPDDKKEVVEYDVFAGGLAAYVSSTSKGTSVISGIKVDAAKFEINAAVDHLYAGNIAGYGTAYYSGNTYFTDCYATSPIKVINTTGYNIIGGLVGRLNLFTGSVSAITTSYNIGDIHSESYHSSHAGGLVGYLFSYGSSYTGGAEKEGYLSYDEEDLSKAQLNASADSDYDIMITNCFSVADVYSLSTEYTSYVGYITGECNTHASVSKVYWPSNVELKVIADKTSKTDSAKVDTTGSTKTLSVFKNEELLVDALAFDFANTWMFADGYDYPVLKCMLSDKPVLKVVAYSLSKDGILNAKVQALSDAESFTVIIGVYSSRNQLLKFERRTFTNNEYASEFDISYSGMKNASRIQISAVETSSLKPLFEAVDVKL